MARAIDKSKKGNVRCEHCQNWSGFPDEVCKLTGEQARYWKKCPLFQWTEGKTYIETTNEVNHD